MQADDTPLLDALLSHAGSGRVSFHMPGHSGGRAFPKGALSAIGALDTTELVSTDDINRPEGPALRAMQLAAEAFGAGRTFFLTTGSTCGIYAMLTVAASANRPLLLPRAVHRSVVNAIALTGTDYQFMRTTDAGKDEDTFSLLRQPSPASIREDLAADPSIAAVLVTSPDYYGLCADLPAIADVVHEAGALLIVDEAHGAHFRFGKDMLPISAMDAGADLCVQSAHKTLPALTQAAFLHLSAEAVRRQAVDPDRVREAISLYQTSSPSFPIAASMNFARAWMQREGAQRIRSQLGHIRKFCAGVPAGMRASGPGVLPPVRRDPLRLVVDLAGTGLSGPAVLKELANRGVDIEMADFGRLVCLPGMASSDDDFDRLLSSLREISRLHSGHGSTEAATIAARLDRTFSRLLMTAPERVSHPRSCLMGESGSQWTALGASEGRVSVRALIPYPPGIPLVWPGEKLDRERVDLLESLVAGGISVNGTREGAPECLTEIRTISA